MTNKQVLNYLKPFMLDGTEKVGDKVWVSRMGEIKICDTIELTHKIEAGGRYFTKDGKAHEADIFPTIFKRCPYPEFPKMMEAEMGESWRMVMFIGQTKSGQYIDDDGVCYPNNNVREIQPKSEKQTKIDQLQKQLNDLQTELNNLKG